MSACCGMATPSCRYCGGTGMVDLPLVHPQAPSIVCPSCEPHAYPQGFPGLVGILPGTMLIPADVTEG